MDGDRRRGEPHPSEIAPPERGAGENGDDAEGVLGGQLAATIAAVLPSLVPSEARVASVFLQSPYDVVYRSVSEVAALAGTSESTVVRCCQRLGFRGFQELKIALAGDIRPAWDRLRSAVSGTSPGDVFTGVLGAGVRAIDRSLGSIDAAAFERALRAIHGAGRVLLVGEGRSAMRAEEAAYLFTKVGVRADAVADVRLQPFAARLLTATDACIGLSHSGATRETVAALKAADEAGATTIAVTNGARSPVARAAQIHLVAGGSHAAPFESLVGGLAISAILYALVMGVVLLNDQANEHTIAAVMAALSART